MLTSVRPASSATSSALAAQMRRNKGRCADAANFAKMARDCIVGESAQTSDSASVARVPDATSGETQLKESQPQRDV
jgi:hypothetical protein